MCNTFLSLSSELISQNQMLFMCRFESADAVKANVTEVMNKLSEDDLQHYFQQCKIRMERCRDRGGEYTECDNIYIL